MRKVADWQMRLHSFLTANRDREFSWGKWDCCVFANEAIKSISGEDVLPAQLKWSSETEAMQAIQDYGRTFANAIKLAARSAGLQIIDVQQITAGDLCVYVNGNEELCGICDGFALLSPTDQGYEFSDTATARLAWRVPDG